MRLTPLLPRRCLALFDWAEDVDESRLLNSLIEAISKNGLVNQFCGASQVEIRKLKQSPYEGFLRALQAGEKFHTVELYYSQNGATRDLTGEWDAALILSRTPWLSKMLAVAFPEASGNPETRRNLIARLAAIGRLNYGMCFRWVDSSSPLFYFSGITHTPSGGDIFDTSIRSLELKDGAQDNEWWSAERSPNKDVPPKMRHLQGYFRDIYEMNILSQAHLNQLIDGVSLADMMTRNSDWGTLASLPNGNWLWTLDQEAVRRVRNIFISNKLLIRTLPR